MSKACCLDVCCPNSSATSMEFIYENSFCQTCVSFFCFGILQMKEKLEGSSSSFANAYRSRNFDEAVTCIQKMTYYQRANEEILKKL